MSDDSPEWAATRAADQPQSERPANTTAAWARFDDLRAGSALRFTAPGPVLVARHTVEVFDVLAQVEAATAAGRWAFGYLAYEAAAAFDASLSVHASTPYDLPLAWFALCDPPITEPALRPADPHHQVPIAAWSAHWTPVEHARRVALVQDRIAAGDTYQCNLTDRVTASSVTEPFELYRHLALAQGGAYNAYLDLGRWVIASASPELFFERRGDDVLLRPMKGTAPRGRHADEDRMLADRLRTSAKECAENVMIVDLMRNDVSRIAVPGTVQVPSLFTVERYPTLLQLTSDVTARLRDGIGLADVFTALFPSGSVTGAPKVSSMRILRSLEDGPRGVYCGAIGFVAPPKSPVRARFSVAIRTAVIDTRTGEACYGTGGGITWDSDPTAEHREAMVKTAVLTTPQVPFTLMETMRYEPGRGLRNEAGHLRRLAASADHLHFACDPEAIRSGLRRRLADSPPARVRLRLSVDGRFAIDCEPLPAELDRPVTLGLDDQPVDPADWRLYHKTSQRSPYDSRRQRQPAVDDVIMINTAGELTETTWANVAVQIGGVWCTPPIDAGCLPGVERARLIAAGELQERTLRPADLAAGTSLAVVNSLRGWRAAQLGRAATRRVAELNRAPAAPAR